MKKTILTILIFLTGTNAFGTDTDLKDILPIPALNIDNKVISAITFESLTKTANTITQNSENSIEGIENATTRYMQTNVVAAYKDFSNIINSLKIENDFLYMTMAQRLAGFGFFSLSQNAIININDNDLWFNSINFLKKLYFPAVTLSYDEEIYLSKLQTATLYNNSAKETIKELEKNDNLLKKSDYADYVLSVAYFENKNYIKSLNAINKAIDKAPECINYLQFKSKIYTQMENYNAALNIIEKIEKTKYLSNYYKDFLYNDKLYILMKKSKKDKEKIYSAKLLYNKGDYQKALRDAQAAINLNKKNPEGYVLEGDYYIKTDEIEKAKEYYQKAQNLKDKYAPALIGLGHYYYLKKEYSTAYEYYLMASKYSSQNDKVYIYMANTLIAKKENDAAADYLRKSIKIDPNSDKAYYLLSQITPNLKEQYLRKSVSLNPGNIYAWLDLAEIYINQGNYKDAKEYLIPVQLIEPNNSRYLYLKKYISTQIRSGIKSSYSNNEFLKIVF